MILRFLQSAHHIGCASLLCVLLTAHGGFADDESAEPPVAYTVKINDDTVTLAPGEPTEVRGVFVNPKVTLAKTRRFPYAGVTFSYPAAYDFEADLEDPEARTWTMDGNDVVIMLFALSTAVTPEELAASTAQELGVTDPDVKPMTMELARKMFKGAQINISVGTQRVHQQFIALPPRGGTHRILVLQDSPDESGKPSEEYESTVKLLKASFVLANPGSSR